MPPYWPTQAIHHFLRKFGEIARRVIFAVEDTAVYLAVLALSEIKEDPNSSVTDIAKAQKDLDEAYAKVTYVSEAQALSRLGWWTTEYGLFKKGNKFLIYGAGLLSSAGESYNCLSEKVKKIPLDIKCTEMDYDVTKPQTQLYYTDDFRKLEATVDELASKMSYKVGGAESLERARVAGTITTAQTETGFQISGVLKKFSPALLEYEGPCQISFGDVQVKGFGPSRLSTGVVCLFGNPVGTGVESLKLGQAEKFKLSTGHEIEGTVTEVDVDHRFAILNPAGDTHDNIILMSSSQVKSVFGGAADRGSFALETKSAFNRPRPPKTNASMSNKNLIPLYSEIRKLREEKVSKEKLASALEKVLNKLDREYPEDWLLRVEILELCSAAELTGELPKHVTSALARISKSGAPRAELIQRGLAVVGS